MVVCSYLHYLPEHFLATWAMFGLAGAVLVALLSTSAFRFLYMNPTLTKWQYKSSGKFPSAHYVREEIYQTFKGVFFATFFPALSMHLRKESYMKGYCPADVTGEADQEYYFSVLRYCWEFVLIVGITDFYEFFYHWCGHKFDHAWNIHRHHHKYCNPTPFAVIADEPFDNCVRASPLFFLPLFLTLNLNTLFLTFTLFFYSWGIYLHCGYEADWIFPSDHPWINTSFQHYVHHAKGTRSRPYHCGFFIKLWDQLFKACYDGPPCDAKSDREAGKRTDKLFQEQVLKNFPNYGLLANWKFLLYGETHPEFAKQLTLDLRDTDSTTASESPAGEGLKTE